MNKLFTSLAAILVLALPVAVTAQSVAPATVPAPPSPQVAPNAPVVQAPPATPAQTFKAEPYVPPKAEIKPKKKKHKKTKKAKKPNPQ